MSVNCRSGHFTSVGICFTLALACGWAGESRGERFDVWIGTVTAKNGPSKGIYHSEFDSRTGKVTEPQLAAELENPGFLALHPGGEVLYSTGTIDGEPSLVAFRFVRKNGKVDLSRLNAQPTGDGGAAHLATDRTGRTLLSAQYGGGSTAIFPLSEEGTIAPRSKLIKHQGGSRAVPGRQDKPHAHWVGTSPDNKFAFVPDLGMDKVVIYRLDSERADLMPHGFGQVPSGGGPRHMKFHPSGKFIYVLNELDLSITVFAYDASEGSMTALQTIPTVSEKEKAQELFVSASEIRVHPSGRFLYAANRGHDTITAFRVDQDAGSLTWTECEPVRGAWPRNFNIDPTGKWLLAAGRDSNNITVFAIHGETGELTYARTSVFVPTPICVLFGSADI